MSKELVLVSCSGGLDSSTSLAILKLAGYENIIAVHFMYGHRGQQCEHAAIDDVCNELEIPLKVFDLESIYDEMDVKSISMLANKNAKIITGTTEGLKTTAAWHPARNLLFMNIMITLAEAEIMKHDYDKVYLCGGFLQLTESATYPDNTPYFANACLNAAKYGTLVGNRIDLLYCLSNLMKAEQFVLIKEFNLIDIYKHTISCDRPEMKFIDEDRHQHDNCDSEKAHTVVHTPCNCSKNGLPACGSGLLSYWASRMVGLDDMKIRNFYEVDDPGYAAHIPQHIKNKFSKIPNINDIINRILLPADKIEALKKKIK